MMQEFLAVILACSSLLLISAPLPHKASAETVAFVQSHSEDASVELLIGWKPGVTIAERDRIIAAWGGKLNRRFRIIKADSVFFESVTQRQEAQTAISLHTGVEHLQAVKPLSMGEVPQTGETPIGSNSAIATGNQITDDVIQELDAYTKKFPAASWRHSNRVQEAQEFAAQKQEVIVAILSDQSTITYGPLQNSLWENSKEKNGLPGVDDDGNGWVDDIHGIDTIHLQGLGQNWATDVAQVVAGVANYAPDRLTNGNGKVKLMPIAAFVTNGDNPYCTKSYALQNTNDTALIEGLEYAAKMGAKVAYVSGYYVYSPSPMVLAAAAAFPGLIITAPDRFSEEYCYGNFSLLLNSGLSNVVGVGMTFVNGIFYSDYYGGPFDLTATEVQGIIYAAGKGSQSSAATVAGIAAHLMSCHPGLNRSQVRDLLLSTVDRNPSLIGEQPWPSEECRTGGMVNAARALLGRSAGGSFYIGDWARISRDGPRARFRFGLAYDSRRSRLYLYGGEILDVGGRRFRDFWFWDGEKWREIRPKNGEDGLPGFGDKQLMYFDEKRDQLVLTGYGSVWRWDGSTWQRQHAILPYNRGEGEVWNWNFTFDSLRDRVVFYKGTADQKILAEYNGKNWNLIETSGASPIPSAPLVYNSNLGLTMALESGKDINYTAKMWSYDGDRWQQIPIEPIVGTDGIILYDDINDRYYRFGSVYNTFIRSPYYENKHLYLTGLQTYDVWMLKDGKWTSLGYDAPTFEYEPNSRQMLAKGVWAADKRKFYFVGEKEHVRYQDNGKISIWQYSGSITPTWIDNLIIQSGDYTGDGRTDLAVWHPGTGKFDVSGGNSIVIGTWGDIPVPGDYDGDGSIEFAVCRRMPNNERRWDVGNLLWIFAGKQIPFGQFDDIPVPLDYDGDGKTDIAVFRKDTATWYFQGQQKGIRFGIPADLPVPADYDGDGKPELATYTPLTSTWHIQGIGDFQWGEPGDSPIPADYDGDGRKEIATRNPRTATWLVRDWRDGGKLINKTFGAKWDIPVPGDYNGDGKTELATYSPITCLWRIQGREPVKFGSPGDLPLVRGN